MSQTTTRRILTALVPLLFFLALAAWGLSSPVGSSPDDDFHLPSIYCGLGLRDGICESSDDPATRLVPAELVGEACYVRDASVSAACWSSGTGELEETDRVNTGPLYPPLFYAAMSVFAGPDAVLSIIAMRLFNAALAVGLITAAFLTMPRTTRAILPVAAVAAAVPLGLFIIPSTNASSWAFLSAVIVWPTLYAATQVGGRRRTALIGLAILGGIIGAGARADAAAFAVFAVVVAALLGARWRRDLVLPAVAAVVIVGISIAFYLSAGQSGSVTAGLPSGQDPLTSDQQISNVLDVPSLWVGVFGGWGLGWLDTPMPATVWVMGFAVFAAVMFAGLDRLSLRRGAALTATVAALWVVPLVLLDQSNAVVGTYVQPRYILPLIVIAAGIAAVELVKGDRWLSAWTVVAGAVLSVTATISLHINIRRYTTGLDDLALDPGSRAEWWWAFALSPAVVWITGSIAFAATFPIMEWLRRSRVKAVTAPSTQGSSTDPGVDSPGLRTTLPRSATS